MRYVFVGVPTVLATAVMALGVIFLTLIEDPWRANDFVTPFFLGPLAMVLAARWMVVIAFHPPPGEAQGPPRGWWRWVPVALVIFSAGALFFATPIARVGAERRDAGGLRPGTVVLVTTIYGLVGGLTTTNLLMIPYTAFHVLRRGPRRGARSE